MKICDCCKRYQVASICECDANSVSFIHKDGRIKQKFGFFLEKSTKKSYHVYYVTRTYHIHFTSLYQLSLNRSYLAIFNVVLTLDESRFHWNIFMFICVLKLKIRLSLSLIKTHRLLGMLRFLKFASSETHRTTKISKKDLFGNYYTLLIQSTSSK